MSATGDTVTIHVTYTGEAHARFDRAWYVERHLPLVLRLWSRYGLLRVAAFFPAVAQDGTQAVCECTFRDAAAVAAAFGSPESAEVMADVANFTDMTPRRTRAAAI
ncbi:EthD family reductase [Paraburkholderia acidisoli]|uniref:EthD family reductase n=1 Tax=Paraburkholderia acidisoli TaxID=2571748 RepID=A0A7Z2GKD0_9BURK|nr:EthD family reductase [Paraburkholderia acidisoli]QGZ63387.1 EthD family reductase [Paraburkholderia acidisoli]